MDINELIQLGRTACQIGSKEVVIPNKLQLEDTNQHNLVELEVKEKGSSNLCKRWQERDFENIKAMCLEINALSLTLKRHELDLEMELQEAVLQRFKSPSFNVLGLNNRAATIIRSLATSKVIERRELGSSGPEFLETIGLGPPAILKASGKKLGSKDMTRSPSTHKRPAPGDFFGPPRSYLLIEEPIGGSSSEGIRCHTTVGVSFIDTQLVNSLALNR